MGQSDDRIDLTTNLSMVLACYSATMGPIREIFLISVGAEHGTLAEKFDCSDIQSFCCANAFRAEKL